MLQKTLLISLLLMSNIGLAQEGERLLNRFLNQVSTYTADFDQVVLDEELRQIDEASGTLSILRPGKFRWDYAPPLEQQIVGDGNKVWIYDLELKQVIVRDQQLALGQSPAILLSGGADIGDDYGLEEVGLQGGFQWIKVTPKSSETSFEQIRIAFLNQRMSIMELLDNLGQTTRINFRNGTENFSLPGDQFTFAPEPGVDVIDETQ
ncbi:MAG: outer membrane lipoprotein carrier protein [Saprospiraceae bacterium]|jgi:outer membrane lipoprotein carrier protein